MDGKRPSTAARRGSPIGVAARPVIDCEVARRLLSRALDGDLAAPGALGLRRQLEAHLGDCQGCGHWREQATFLGRTVTVASAQPPRRLVPDLLGRLDVAARRRSRAVLAIRAALTALALLGTVLAVPMLALGDDGMDPHPSHEIGSVEIALCAGLLAAALWPQRARGVLAVLASAAGLLVVTAGSDIAAGYTTAGHEIGHTVVIAGAALVWWLSRLVPEAASPWQRTAVVVEAESDALDARVDVVDARRDAGGIAGDADMPASDAEERIA